MKQKQLKKQGYTRLPMIFIGVLTALWPLTGFPVTITLTEAESVYVPNLGGAITDLCVRSREILLFAAGAALVLFWLGERVFPDKPRRSPLLSRHALPLMAGTGLILLTAVLSGIFSLHPEISFWGIASESTGIAAFIGLAALLLAAYEGMSSPENLKYITAGATAAGLLCGGMLLFEKLSGQLAGILWGAAESAGTMLLFGSSTSCGEFGALLFPFLLHSALTEPRRGYSIAQALSAGAALCTALSSMSSAAFYGLLAGITALVILLTVRVFRGSRPDWKKSALIAAAAVPAAVLLIAQPGILTASAGNSVSYSPENSWGLTSAELSGGTLRLRNSDTELVLTADSGAVTLADSAGETALLAAPGDSADIAGVHAQRSGDILSLDLGYTDVLRFAVMKNELGYVGLNGYIQPLEQSAFPELSEYYGAFTGRGYIWLNTLPALKNCFLIGTGTGEFCFHYPQNDIVGALNTHGSANLLTDKPHSMYLGLTVSCGIPALLIFLALAVITLRRGAVSSVRGGVLSGAFAAVIAALVMGLANDISPVYSPLAAVFAGILCSRPDPAESR